MNGCEMVTIDAARPATSRDAMRAPPLSFAQERLWFLDQLEPASPIYNVAIAVRIAGKLDARVLETALAAVLARHSALRTTFRNVEGRPQQVIAPHANFRLAREELHAACTRCARAPARVDPPRGIAPVRSVRGAADAGSAGSRRAGRPRPAAHAAPYRVRRLVDGRATR